MKPYRVGRAGASKFLQPDRGDPIEWDAQPVSSPGGQINRTAVAPICDWNSQPAALVRDLQPSPTREVRVRRTDSPVLVRLAAVRRPAMKPRVINRGGYLPGIGWSAEAARQPEEQSASHASSSQ